MPATPTNVQLDFEPDDALTVLSPKDTSLLQHINYLQRICTQIDGIKNNRIDAPVVRRIFTLASEFITLLYSYALELDYGKDRKYDASVEYKQLSQNMSHGSAFNRSAGRLSCLDDKPCVGGEKLVFERRLLAALSVICRGCPCLTTSLLDSAVDQNELDVDMEENTEQVSFVDLLAITLTNIGFLVRGSGECFEIQRIIPLHFAQIENLTFAQRTHRSVVHAADFIGQQLHANRKTVSLEWNVREQVIDSEYLFQKHIAAEPIHGHRLL